MYNHTMVTTDDSISYNYILLVVKNYLIKFVNKIEYYINYN